MLRISIAMATYNGSKHLLQQLESLAKQTVPPLELVVTDDGSTDDTVEIVEAFARTAPFKVSIHRNSERLGFRGNFMKAIGLCAGDVVACCDQDDVWDPVKLERVGAAFTDEAAQFVFHGAWLIDGEGGRIAPANLLALPRRSKPLSFFPLLGVLGFAMAFRRELAGFAGYWPRSVDHLSLTNRMAHDQWFFFLASSMGDIIYLDERLVEYRQHGGNTYGVKPPTLASTIAYKLRNHGCIHRDFAAAATARADLLADMLPDERITDMQAMTMQQMIVYYRELSARLALRGQIYLGRNLGIRVKAYRMLKAMGGYDASPIWNVSPRAALKDVALGLVLRPLMTNPVEQKAIT